MFSQARLTLLLASALVLPTWPVGPATAVDQGNCNFSPGFQGLHDLIVEQVGNCVETQQVNPVWGNGSQHTGGTLSWQLAGNLASFTDGQTNWLVGPDGLISLPTNGPPFSWDAVPVAGVAVPTVVPTIRSTTAGALAPMTGLIPAPASTYAFPPSAIGAGFREVGRQESPDGRAFVNRIVAGDAQPSGSVWVSMTDISLVDTRLWVFASAEEATNQMDGFLTNLRKTFNVEPAVGWGSDQVYSYAYRSGTAMYRGIALRHHNATMALSVAGLEQYATWDHTARLARLVESGLLTAANTEGPASPTPTEAPQVPTSVPPEPGTVVFADPLTWPGRLVPGTCPTGRNKGEFVGEGFILKVTGRCSPADSIAVVVPPPLTVNFADGEARVEFKTVSGHERASVIVGVREQSERPDQSYQVIFLPAASGSDGGVAAIGVGGTHNLVEQTLTGLFARDDWNTVAVRTQGTRLWVMLNEQLILFASDSSYDRGNVYLALRRIGDLDDGQESAVVFRNLRISALTGGPPDRVPTVSESH